MSNVSILIGAQWGDEGKGKWVDILSEKADIVARFQGGNNAGHTVHIDGRKFVLHQIPSGVFRPHLKSAIAAGVVVNPSQLLSELGEIKTIATPTPDKLWLSARAHVITPWHIHLDERQESRTQQPIGTTKRGIGPAYADKASRLGLRLGQYVDDRTRDKWVQKMASENEAFKAFWSTNPAAVEMFHSAASGIKPFVCDAEARLRKAVREGKQLLIEGAQGTMLDLDHGTYPFVTSNSPTSGGACASLGLGPKTVSRIYGITKAYVTRVGEGPMPTELKDDVGAHLSKVGNEFGATTRRPRRCGWLDMVALRYAIAINGCDRLILNKIDVLTGLSELKIAVSYRHPQLGTIEDFPWEPEVLKDCVPVYETLAGWTDQPQASGRFEGLPKGVRHYISTVERLSGVRVTMIGTGVGREDAVILE